jgi:iron(III) transport system substrate-binding protein
VRINRRAAGLTLGVSALLVLGLAACGSDEPASGTTPGASPASDGTLTLYSGRSESLIKPLLEIFTAKTGIAVQARYGDTAQMAAQLLEEGGRTPADVFLAQDAGALGAVAKEGLFAPLPAAVLDKVPPAYRAKSGEWVGVSGRSRVIVYNTDQVTTADLPKSIFDLTGPAWRGKVGIAPTNGSFQAFVTALRVQHGDAKASEFLAGLKANDAKIFPGNGQIVADVNAGKTTLGLVNHYYIYERAKEDGTTVDKLKVANHFLPDGDTGALVNVAGVGLLKRTAADPDAQTFLSYLLDTEAQTYFANETSEYPMVSGITTATNLPPLTTLRVPPIDLNDLDSLAATIELIKEADLA